jgi:uncharacterized membrane protein
MNSMSSLIVALTAFVGTHFLMSHPLRAPLVERLGAMGFQIAYTAISLGTFFWAVQAFKATPLSIPLWVAGDALWWVASVLMLIGSILFAGSIAGNPALPSPKAAAQASAPAHGTLAITRHPMMWSFAIWALVHVLIAPQPRVIILCAAIAFLAVAGSAGQDRKKAVLMGEGWRDWTRRTSFIPFGNQIAGKAAWSTAWPGSRTLLLGTLLWLIATYGHAWFGIYGAGIWRWIWTL